MVDDANVLAIRAQDFHVFHVQRRTFGGGKGS